MKVKLFKFDIPDFEEVYVIIDNEHQRLHISLLNCSSNITLNMNNDLNEEVKKNTKFGEENIGI